LGTIKIVTSNPYNPALVQNCLGGAMSGGADTYCYPDSSKDKDKSFIEAMAEVGYKCFEVTTRDECVCECEEKWNSAEGNAFFKRKILITTYNIRSGSKKDPWGDPDFKFKFTGGFRNDIHAISMDGHGYWTEIPMAADKDRQVQHRQMTERKMDKYFGGKTKMLCCCQDPNKKYNDDGIAK
jgi:hypothetical protein